MSQYTLSINLNISDFPELGNPIYPNKDIAKKVPKAHRDDYKGYMQSCGIGMDSAVAKVNENILMGSECSISTDNTSVKMNLPYDKETSKTYKFMGMDIDEDFNAVIKLGEGHVTIDSMFNRDRIDSVISNTDFRTDLDEQWLERMLLQMNSTVNDSVVRKIVTSLKTGSIYSMIKEWGGNDDYTDFFSKFVQGIIDDIHGDGEENTAVSAGSLYDSIILNLVNEEEIEKLSIKGSVMGDSDAENEKKIVECYIASLLKYWSDLAKTYSAYVTHFAAMDIWSDLNKKVIGNGDFNQRFSKCVDIQDNITGEIVGNMVSFAGVSRNGGVSDQSILRDQAATKLNSFSSTVTGNSRSGDVKGDLKYILMSMVDDTDIEDIYSLTDEEAQALSSLDSLRYIDEEAALSRASYNMDDPDERGLFVKSAIRSYERNFREFKPVDNYDVTEAFAEMVERGDIESNQTVSQEILITKSEDEVGDIITMSGEDIKVTANVQSLKRVMKMINKFSKDILAGI